MQTTDQFIKLGAGAGLRQHGVADVVFHIHVVVQRPDRVGQFKRHVDQFASENWGQMHALGDVGAQIVHIVAGIARRQFKNIQPTYVHGLLGRF